MNRLSPKIAAAVDAQVIRGPGTISVESGDRTLLLRYTTGGPVGLALESLELSNSAALQPLTDRQLRTWADRLVSRVNYLMEPLVVLEVDTHAGAADVRSAAPSKREGTRTYYKFLLNHNSTIQLIRVLFRESDRTSEAIPFQLTTEAIERLVEDMEESLERVSS